MKTFFLRYLFTIAIVSHAILPSQGYSYESFLFPALMGEVLEEMGTESPEPPESVSQLDSPEPIESPEARVTAVEEVPNSVEKSEKPLVEIRRMNLFAKLAQHTTEGSGLRSFLTNVGQEIASASLSVGVNTFATFLKQRIAEYFHMENSIASGASDLIMTQMAATSISQSASNMRSGFQELGGSPAKMKVRALRLVHRELVQESEVEDGALPEDVRTQIKRVDEAIYRETALSEPRADFLATLVERRELILRSIPSRPKNIAQYDKQGDPSRRAEINQRVKELIEEYPFENRDTISSLVQKIRDNSIFAHSDRAQAYLYGPPGTGKTRFVQRLAKALDLPLCEISFKDSKEEDILGKNYDALVNLTEKDIEVTGKLARCFIEAGVTNPIIFFDEAGETLSEKGLNSNASLLSFLKDILDPERSVILFRGMGVRLDFSRATVIFAGNEKMENSALRSRLPSIYFGSLGYAQRAAATDEASRRVLVELEEVFPLKDVEMIRGEFEKYKEFLIEADMAVNPGARILKAVVLDTLNFIRVRVLNHEPIEEAHIKKVIQSSLEQRSPVKEQGNPG